MFLLGTLIPSRNFYGKRFFLFLALVLLLSPVLHATVASDKTRFRTDHLTMEFGLGGTGTVGTTSNYASEPGFSFLAGIGYRVNRHLSIPFEYDFSVHGDQSAVLQQAGQPRGFFYFNTFSVNPMWAVSLGKYMGGYLVGGGGLSNKDASFGNTSYSNNNCGSGYSGYSGYARRKDYGCPAYNAVATYSSVQPMLDIGGGITERFHEHGRGRMFLDVRYVKMYSPVENFPGFETAGTELIPITFGVRF